MYYPINDVDLEVIRQRGLFGIRLDITDGKTNSRLDIVNRNNSAMRKTIFKLNLFNTQCSLMCTEIESVFPFEDLREYEAYTHLAVEALEKRTRCQLLDEVFVQSRDSRIMEVFYERNFDFLALANIEPGITIYTAVKDMREKK